MNLTCKVQYNDFEPGEFTDIKQVDFKTAIAIIEKFPWVKQRDHIQIDLTSPSVSFEYSPDCILKLALYYNNKFVLHFFDGTYLYTKGFIDYTSTYSFIEYFFEHQSIDLSVFKKENTWFKKIDNHFKTNDFVYAVKGKNPWKYTDSTTKILTIMILVFTSAIAFQSGHKPIPFIGYFSIFLMLLIYIGINYILLLNYYLYAKNKLLHISRGNDTFLWGEYPDNLKAYNKNDVTEIIVKQNKGSRCPWGDFTITLIYFKDDSFIKIPSVLLAGRLFHYKIPRAPYKVKQTIIPFCNLNNS